MEIDPAWPEWVVRQGFTCAWVQSPSATAAIELAARRLGHMGGWNGRPVRAPTRRCSRPRSTASTRGPGGLHPVGDHRVVFGMRAAAVRIHVTPRGALGQGREGMQPHLHTCTQAMGIIRIT